MTQKTILITGGTGTLGTALINAAEQHGFSVLFTYHSHRDRANTLSSKYVRGLYCDLSDRDSVHHLCTTVTEMTESLYGIVFNAAAVRDHTLMKLPEEDWDHVLSVNIRSIQHMSRLLQPLLEKSAIKPAKIITLISRVGLHGAFGQANYAASKDWLIEYTRIRAIELADKNIIVNGVNPGFMLSDMTTHIPEAIREQHKNDSLLKQYSNPAEVAQFILFLLSEICTQVTGQLFHYEARMV